MGKTMKLNKLTARQVETAKKVGKYGDGGGLWLKIRRPGDASWVFSYMVDGRAREFGLGARHSVNLAEARELARRARQMILDGVDPIEERKARMDAQRIEALRTITFAEACERFLATDRVESFRNAVHRKQWKSTLAKAYPVLGDLPLQSIDSAVLLNVLLPIMKRTPETGSRLRGRIERVIEWARPLGLFTGPNPAAREALKDHLPAKRKVVHHRALPYQQLPQFMADLRQRDNVSARALEFLTLTAARTGEVIGARWEEFNLAEATWTVPASRMKAGVEHVVPLSDAALEILARLGEPRGNIFRNGNGKPLSNMAMLALMKGMGVDATPHGMRAAFNTWAKNQTNFAPETRNAALAHTEEKLESAYTRDKNRLMFAKRARLMSEWARYLDGGRASAVGDNVRALRS
jgi:integrase